jgi:hypothetical protein
LNVKYFDTVFWGKILTASAIIEVETRTGNQHNTISGREKKFSLKCAYKNETFLEAVFDGVSAFKVRKVLGQFAELWSQSGYREQEHQLIWLSVGHGGVECANSSPWSLKGNA